ncbi:cysteine peptidase family C39 domain-containing protein [Chryseobacterium aquaticum]|uniref:cysteine peptidase family C39 domain-containing protein n=1 Tax=Chryseobacterium aquaticum TaxID=452084 RepID=UPI003F72E222
MKEFDDEFGDLSQFKTLTFEEVSKGFAGNKSALGDTVINRDDFPEYRSPFHDYRNTPLGYSYLTDDPVSVFASTGVDKNGKKGYEYRAEVLPCENGSQVLGSYNANKREPQSLFLFYEKPDSKKSNFAGDFYIAKMGDYFVQLFKRFPEPLPSNIGGKFFKNITSMEDEAAYLAQLAYTYEGDKINATLARDALMREYQYYTGDRRFEEIIGNITSIPADAFGWCAEQLEDLKPTEKNYNPESKDYAPLIPLPINTNKASDFFENLGNNPFVQGAEVAFTQVWELVKRAASKVKDASIEHLPDAFKGLVEKISSVINTIKNFLTEVKDELVELTKIGVEILKIANAFYCGINSGLVGLLQCILYILQALFQPTTAFSYEQYKERRDLLEKAEDVLDWILVNAPVFFKGVKDLFSSSGGISQSDFEGIFDKLKEYWDNTSRYTVAFYVGIIAFEFIINILLLIFTAGSGNIIKGTTYVQKAASLLKVITREAMSAVTFGITDLLALLSRFIVRFGKACVKGFKGFIKFIEELFTGAKNGVKAEDLIEEAKDIEEVIIKGRKFQKGGGDVTKSFAENAGIKIEKWISETKIFGQSTDHTCASTSLRMVLDDKGILKLEDELARALKTDADGASILDIPDALYFKRLEEEVTAIAESKIFLPKLLEKLEDGDKAIVSIATKQFPGHAVVLEKVENGRVFLRDPLPMHKGSSYSMKLEDFEKIFNRRAVIIKK